MIECSDCTPSIEGMVDLFASRLAVTCPIMIWDVMAQEWSRSLSFVFYVAHTDHAKLCVSSYPESSDERLPYGDSRNNQHEDTHFRRARPLEAPYPDPTTRYRILVRTFYTVKASKWTQMLFEAAYSIVRRWHCAPVVLLLEFVACLYAACFRHMLQG